MGEPANWQERVSAFARANGLLHDPATHALDLVSEVGEVAKEILRATDYGGKPFAAQPGLVGELGDALYSILILAEASEVDAGGALEKALDKYEQRLARHGGAGSK